MICLALVSFGALFNLGNAVIMLALCYTCSGLSHYVCSFCVGDSVDNCLTLVMNFRCSHTLCFVLVGFSGFYSLLFLLYIVPR